MNQDIQKKYIGIKGAGLLGGGWDRLLLNIYTYVSSVQGHYLRLRPEFQTESVVAEKADKPLFLMTVYQIKAKWAGLRFYYDIQGQEFDWTRFDKQDYNKWLSRWSYEIRGFISAMEMMSYSVCERSGDLGKIRDINGWLYTLSDAEYAKTLQNN